MTEDDRPPLGGFSVTIPTTLTNPIALLRLFVLVVLALGILTAIPGFDAGDSYTRPILRSAFVTTFLLSVLVLTLLLLNRPAAEQRGDQPDLVDSVIAGIRPQLPLLPLIVFGLGVLDALIGFPRSDLDRVLVRGLSGLSWDLAVALAASALVAALTAIVLHRQGTGTGDTVLQPPNPAAAAALLRDGAVVVAVLTVAAAGLAILDELDDITDNVRGFADTFENALWFLMALVATEVVLLGLAWAIEQRYGIEDAAELPRLARRVPRSRAGFWDGAALTRQAPKAFGTFALLYIVANFLAWSNIGVQGPPAFDGTRQLAVLLSDTLWVSVFGSVLITVTAGIVMQVGGQDNVSFISTQGLYLVGAAASLAAIGDFIHQGSSMGLHDALVGTLAFRWGIGACALSGLVSLRALYWDRTVPIE